MDTFQILRHLYSLDTSSPDFSRYLDHLIKSDEEDCYLLNLEGSDLIRLVDFLDKVRVPLLLPSSLRNRLHRPSPSSWSLTMSPDCVCTSCKPSAATAGSCHLRTLLLAASPSLAITRSPLEDLAMFGKGHTTVSKCVSNARRSPHKIARASKRSIIYAVSPSRLLNDKRWHVGIPQGNGRVEMV